MRRAGRPPSAIGQGGIARALGRIALTALVAVSYGGMATGRAAAPDGRGAILVPPVMSRSAASARAAALTELGRRMFFDPHLSASGRLSCAGCHDPAHAYAAANRRSVQRGGADMAEPGLRAVPSLTYNQAVPPFAAHDFAPDEGDESIDNGPTGGLTWDGRVDSGREQAAIPLLSRYEMANRSPMAVVVRARSYLPTLRRIFGPAVGADTGITFAAITETLATFEQDSATFAPYTSKYDLYLQGWARLSAQEARGLSLFNDPARGNCAACHISRISEEGALPAFSDFGMVALGVPRNPAIPANADPHYHDLGLCGPLRTDFTDRPSYCGLFRTPSLRNVARRRSFFHNGVYHTLAAAVRFYVLRDTDPAAIYPRGADGRPRKFDDLPRAARANVTDEAPFGGRPGDRPALSAPEIADVVAFLRTLTDGYVPVAAAASAPERWQPAGQNRPDRPVARHPAPARDPAAYAPPR